MSQRHKSRLLFRLTLIAFATHGPITCGESTDAAKEPKVICEVVRGTAPYRTGFCYEAIPESKCAASNLCGSGSASCEAQESQVSCSKLGWTECHNKGEAYTYEISDDQGNETTATDHYEESGCSEPPPEYNFTE